MAGEGENYYLSLNLYVMKKAEIIKNQSVCVREEKIIKQNHIILFHCFPFSPQK